MPIIPIVDNKAPEKKDTTINIPVVPGTAIPANFAYKA